ncbi:MAG TPA: tetratricopeptide repeat protein [Steroidobacteraceae bacterium]
MTPRRTGTIRVTLHCAVLLAMAPLAMAAKPAASPPAPTIGDLDAKSVPINPAPAPVKGGGADKAMENYRQFLNLQNADPRLRAEAMRRLGDLSLESGELERMANEVTQLDMQGAEAIRLYTTLLKAYPEYQRNDQVLYQLARAYETTGQSAQALATLDIIVARYPRGRDFAEVQFRRGELLFSARRYPEAQLAYEAVLARGRNGSTFYPQSLYKHGWSLFKQGLNEDSLTSFADLLDLTLDDPHNGVRMRPLESLGRADRELTEDTLRVMSITFSYLDGVKGIDDFVARRGRMPYAWLLYSRLGDLYVDKQRYQDAAATYRSFASRNEVDEHSPTLEMAAIEAYRKGGFSDLVLAGKLEFVQRYGFGAPFWLGREHGSYPQLVEQLKTNLKDVAQYYHASAQKTKKSEDYTAAAHWYRAYLSSFPGDADAAATNYLLADALFESGQFLDAAAEYEHTAYGYPRNARSAEAGYAALVAYQKYEDTLSADARAATHQRATESGLKFAQTFPEHPESAVVQTHVAQDLYAAGDQSRAAQTAQALLARNPPVDTAKQRIAWTIVGQVSFNQADYVQAEGAFTHALAAAAANDPERADITERLAAAVYKQGDAKRSAGDQAGAAQDFLRVARIAPGSKVIVTSQYDAAAALISAQQWDQAIAVLEAYKRDYPKSDYSADIDRKLAVAYERGGHAGQAAAAYERVAGDRKEEPAVVREAIVKAADLYAQSGDAVHSTVMLERLVRDYPTPVPDAIEVRQRLADAASKAGNLERQRYWQREIVKADAQAGAARTDRTKFLAARAQLALAEPTRDAFRDIKLVAPLKRTLEAKKKAMEAAVQAYKHVAEYQVAETTTAATYETAELYRTLAHDLMASERPKRLTADELEQYDTLLEEQAYPFEEQSISIHEINVKRAREGVYDDSVRKSFDALAQLLPARYGKVEHSETWVAALAAPIAAPGTTTAALADYERAAQLARAGKPTEAELQLQQFELQYPGYAAPAIDLGLLTRGEGKLADSEAALRRATTIEPGNAIAWTELGLTLRQEGKFSDARSAYGQAISADAAYAPAHRNLGVLLDLYLDDPAAALPEFERYKELSGEDKPVSAWIAELRTRTGVKASPASDAAPPAGPPASAGSAPDAPAAPGVPAAPGAPASAATPAAPATADTHGGAT